MSRGPLQRTVSFAIAFSVAACSGQPENYPTSIAIKDTPSQSLVALSGKPASLGWQEQARTLVGVNNLRPHAAALIYAALSVAQYSTVTAANDSESDGQLSANGLGAGGRSAL